MADEIHGSSAARIPTENEAGSVAQRQAVKLSDRERACLLTINDLAHGEAGYGIYFIAIAKETGLSLHQVRRSVRALSRKGLAELNRGLFTDDGMIAGSGYGVTPAGRSWVRRATGAAQ